MDPDGRGAPPRHPGIRRRKLFVRRTRAVDGLYQHRYLSGYVAPHILKGIVRMTGPTLAVQELLYGFIMALIFVTAARLGVLQYSSAEGLVILISGMNLTWGAIDAIVFYLLDVFDQRKLVRAMRGEDGLTEEQRVDLLADSFSGTPLDLLDPEEEREACRRILSKGLESEEEMAADRRAMRISSLGCFIITALTIVPTAVPILLFEDVDTGLTVASVLSSLVLMMVGYRMGPMLGVSKWGMALLLTVVSWSMTIAATFTGGRGARARSRDRPGAHIIGGSYMTPACP